MKTAISIPDETFSQAERFAKGHNLSRSALFTIAVEEYLQHHRQDSVTEKLNKIYPAEDSSLDPAIDNLQTLSLPKEDW